MEQSSWPEFWWKMDVGLSLVCTLDLQCTRPAFCWIGLNDWNGLCLFVTCSCLLLCSVKCSASIIECQLVMKSLFSFCLLTLCLFAHLLPPLTTTKILTNYLFPHKTFLVQRLILSILQKSSMEQQSCACYTTKSCGFTNNPHILIQMIFFM